MKLHFMLSSEHLLFLQVPVSTVPEESDELDREAKWIYEQGFIKPVGFPIFMFLECVFVCAYENL